MLRQIFFLPGVKAISAPMYHVDARERATLFSDLAQALMFSTARIGGVNNDDNIIRHNKGVRAFTKLCEMGGINIEAAMADAARKQIMEQLRDPTAKIKYMFKPFFDNRITEKNFKINYALAASEIVMVQKGFPELNVMITGKVNHPHAMAAVVRDCSEAFILKLINYDEKYKPNGKYNAYIVDIGANFTRHIKKHRFNIHCFNPIVDFRDSARETSRRTELEMLMHKSMISEKTYNDYISVNGNPILRCRKLTQECEIKAKYGMIIHLQYDISLQDLSKTFDKHNFEIVWTVINFDIKVLYCDKGVIDSIQANFVKRDNKFFFSFVIDSSLSYVHNLDDYMKILTQPILVTSEGRIYLIERLHLCCGALFMKYTYCAIKPIYNTFDSSFNYWNIETDFVVLATWDYDDNFFSDSKFKTRADPIVSFKRKYIEVDKKFFDLLYGHCLRSGDKSFNLNEVFSAALTFNTRISINGNDIRAINKVPTVKLMDVVVAIYCLAYKSRYNAGKKLEKFVADEKFKRECRRIGFVSFVRTAWKAISESVSAFDHLIEIWHKLIDKLAKVETNSHIDAILFESVKNIEITDFLKVRRKFEYDCEEELLDDCDVSRYIY